MALFRPLPPLFMLLTRSMLHQIVVLLRGFKLINGLSVIWLPHFSTLFCPFILGKPPLKLFGHVFMHTFLSNLSLMTPIFDFNFWHLRNAPVPSQTTFNRLSSLTLLLLLINLSLVPICVNIVLKGLGLDYSMFVTAVINSPPLIEFPDLHFHLLTFENQT